MNDLQETLVMINILIDQIDMYYSVNSTLIRDVRAESAKFVLEKVKKLLTMQLIKEVFNNGE